MRNVAKNLSAPIPTFPDEVQQGDTLLYSLTLQTSGLSAVYLEPHFSNFCVFYWGFHYLSWPEI